MKLWGIFRFELAYQARRAWNWLIFAALLLGRRIYGWRGRTAISWTLAGFMSLMLAYVGVKFVLEVLLGR